MTTIDHLYTQLLMHVSEGQDKADRTEIGTVSKFGTMLHFDLSDDSGEKRYLPLISVRKTPLRYAFEELLFMLNGHRDTTRLEEKSIDIWKGNTSREFLEGRGLDHYPDGDMGRMYGVQLRDFHGIDDQKGDVLHFDQLAYMFNTIESDPNSRRIISSHYNPAEAGQGVLFPCHLLTQFAVNNGRLDCLFFMRSSDIVYGLPINLNYYALMTHFIAKAHNLVPGTLVYQAADTHIYNNQMASGMVDYMIDNQANLGHTFSRPELNINKELHSLDDILSLSYTDIELLNYAPCPDFDDKPPMAI